MKNKKLFDQFRQITTREWREKINADLKGADFNDRLIWKTREGIEVKPFYRMEDIENLPYINTLPGEFPYIRGTKANDNKWRIRQNIEVTDFAKANRKVLNVLNNGVDSIGFIIVDADAVSEKNFRILLEGIPVETTEINFLCNGRAVEILKNINKITVERGLAPLRISGAIEADPLGRLIGNGKLCVPVEEGFDYLASLSVSSAAFPSLRTIHLNASTFNNSGADIVKELALGLSMGSEYITQLTERGINANLAASKIRFSFGIGSGYFTEIAKLRAARLLWSLITKGFNIDIKDEIKMDIHCVTSRWNKREDDPYVNMLRTQTEAMAAILGGTDSLTIEPFDITFRHPDKFSERIARNQQLILKEESFFGRVADPAGGSYYVENLTNLIAEHSWKLFLEIEDQGGFLASFGSGYIQKKISDPAVLKGAR